MLVYPFHEIRGAASASIQPIHAGSFNKGYLTSPYTKKEAAPRASQDKFLRGSDRFGQRTAKSSQLGRPAINRYLQPPKALEAREAMPRADSTSHAFNTLQTHYGKITDIQKAINTLPQKQAEYIQSQADAKDQADKKLALAKKLTEQYGERAIQALKDRNIPLIMSLIRDEPGLKSVYDGIDIFNFDPAIPPWYLKESDEERLARLVNEEGGLTEKKEYPISADIKIPDEEEDPDAAPPLVLGTVDDDEEDVKEEEELPDLNPRAPSVKDVVRSQSRGSKLNIPADTIKHMLDIIGLHSSNKKDGIVALAQYAAHKSQPHAEAIAYMLRSGILWGKKLNKSAINDIFAKVRSKFAKTGAGSKSGSGLSSSLASHPALSHGKFFKPH